MSYQHTGDAWTDVVTSTSRQIYCDGCAEAARAVIRGQHEDDEDLGMRFTPHRPMLVGYFTPDYDDICDTCGVVAANQHQEQE